MRAVPELGSAVVLVTGVMASGKSTVAQLLAERLPRSPTPDAVAAREADRPKSGYAGPWTVDVLDRKPGGLGRRVRRYSTVCS